MSSASIRKNITDYLQAATIPGLHQVYTAPPWFVDGRDFISDSPLGHSASGAVAAVHLLGESEQRITLPHGTGQKSVTYRASVIIWYQYLLPAGLDAGSVLEDDWVYGIDGIIDGIKDRIRADPGFGTAGTTTLFQGGEEMQDLVVSRELPRHDGGRILSWQVIEFQVVEIVGT